MYTWNDLNTAKAILWEKHISLFDKMATLPTDHNWCVLEFASSNSIVMVQCAFGQQFGHLGPPVSSIQRWYEQQQRLHLISREGSGRKTKRYQGDH
jgi:hypothetical protein